MHYIKTENGLKKLLKRTQDYGRKAIYNTDFNLDDFIYWRQVVEGCISEKLAMDETDWENAPTWFKPLWTGLR